MSTLNEWINETIPYDRGLCFTYDYRTTDGNFFGLVDVPDDGPESGLYPGWRYIISEYTSECNDFQIMSRWGDHFLPKNWFFT
jgi:hypothetical protein